MYDNMYLIIISGRKYKFRGTPRGWLEENCNNRLFLVTCTHNCIPIVSFLYRIVGYFRGT